MYFDSMYGTEGIINPIENNTRPPLCEPAMVASHICL